MLARRNSTCPACHAAIIRGEEIKQLAGRRAYGHAACADGGELSYKQRYGRCEDAPCCGCCGPQGDGDYYGRSAAEWAYERAMDDVY